MIDKSSPQFFSCFAIDPFGAVASTSMEGSLVDSALGDALGLDPPA